MLRGSNPNNNEWPLSSSSSEDEDDSHGGKGTERRRGEVSAHWFRHGIRLHDNPALLASLENCDKFYAIFIFDGETAGMKIAGVNRIRYLLESVDDVCQQLKAFGGEVLLCTGEPSDVITKLFREVGLTRLTFEQDCEAIWNRRDDAVRLTCAQLGIQVVECVSHTLWDPREVIKANGGQPPLTYEMFIQVTSCLGLPPRPCGFPDFNDVEFGEVSESLALKLELYLNLPTPEDLGFQGDGEESPVYVGGETMALAHLQERLKVEEEAFKEGYILPNQVNPDILGPPMSMSAALRFGCLSVRKFYWDIQGVYYRLYKESSPPTYSLTAQLIWREFFYCMSANNSKYNVMKDNPICIQIPWYEDEEKLSSWEYGRTGYPFIDACMRQLRKEGWIHHTCRTAVACFLTRGDLWISWEKGVEVFLRYLIDADWSVCAGNWMWVSSSAFERQLDCSSCICPVEYGRRIEPTGDYIKRYVPELKYMPLEYLFRPWRAPLEVQQKARCIIGKDYPNRIVVHSKVSKENRRMMREISRKLRRNIPHCCPSNPQETTKFLALPESCHHNLDG